MSLLAGARLGPYEVLTPLGAGGMGEVYRAKDTRLDREVAIKVLPERLAADPRALARFEREAKAVAALSHPNILAIHDLGEQGGVRYTVTELLDGETLRERISRERLPWRKAVDIGIAIADGLAAAHARGIVHRDLKPENVFLTSGGLVKILDFGLARTDVPPEDATSAPTAAVQTEAGTVLGTVGYMSPEQVSGEVADARSDIFSLGCVLYEMLAGRRAFGGGTPGQTMAAILRDQPPEIAGSAAPLPAGLDRVVARCLEKNRDERFQTARDLAFALKEISGASASVSAVSPPAPTAVPTPSARGRRWWPPAAAAAAALVLLLIVDPGGLRDRLFRSGGAPSARTLAVLPLANMTGDPGQDYFVDAMTEEITTDLAKIANLRVTSRTSVMPLKGKTIPEVAKTLGVEYVVEGSVVRDSQHVKITAQLIDAASDKHVWANSFQREAQDILALQDEIARAIAREVGAKLTPEGKAGRAAATRPVLPAAYDAYVRGRNEYGKRKEANLREAIRLFQESIDADPTYAPAYAGMSDCYSQLGYNNYLSPADSFPRAKAAAQKALELDPRLAEAHASLGYVVMYYDWNFPLAEKEYRRAIELNPSYAVGHQWYAYLLMATGRPKDSLAEVAVAQRLDPLSVAIQTDQGYMLYYSSQTDAALRAIETALEMDPNFPAGHFWLGRIYTSQKKFDQAEAEFEKVPALRPWTPMLAAIGFLYGQWGKPEKADAILQEFAARASQGKFASSYAIALVYAGLGDKARTLDELDKAYEERSHWLLWLNNDPRLDLVRKEPRFREIVRKVGLPATGPQA